MKSFSQIKGRSAEYARNRIKLLLVSERIDCSPQMISMLKNDLIHTVKKYISIDEKQVTVQITHRNRRLSMRRYPYAPKRNKGQNVKTV